MAMTPMVSTSGSPMTQKKPRFSWPKRIVPSRITSAPTMRALTRNERQNVCGRRLGEVISGALMTLGPWRNGVVDL